MRKPKLAYFESIQDAVNYGVSELLDTLQDDYNRMTHDKYERWHYKASDRQEMRRRISDLRKCEPIMRKAPYVDEMYSLLLEMARWLERKKKRRTAPELLENLQPRIKKVVIALKGRPTSAA
ncbi:MAG TPA: hypothetical protein VFG71_01810 [Nitrospiraceae bacterium]|nr:hypothetical protein [Nitrospiraceae bacterium]